MSGFENKGSFSLDFRDFEHKFDDLVTEKMMKAAKRGLFNAGAEMLRDADKEAPMLPKEFGDLKGSKRIEANLSSPKSGIEVVEVRPKADMIEVKVGYTIKYAERQHEAEPGEFNYTTTKGSPQPGPKFLEKKMVAHKKKYVGIAADTVARCRV